MHLYSVKLDFSCRFMHLYSVKLDFSCRFMHPYSVRKCETFVKIRGWVAKRRRQTTRQQPWSNGMRGAIEYL